MTTIERLRAIAEYEAREHLRDFWRVNLIECYGDTLTDEEIDEVLHMIRTEARVPAPPRIIRTADELAALDPDTILDTGGWGDPWTVEEISTTSDATSFLPAVVLATGDTVRAARQALEAADATD